MTTSKRLDQIIDDYEAKNGLAAWEEVLLRVPKTEAALVADHVAELETIRDEKEDELFVLTAKFSTLTDDVARLTKLAQEREAEASAQFGRAQAIATAAVNLLQIQGDFYRLRELCLSTRDAADAMERARLTLLDAIKGK